VSARVIKLLSASEWTYSCMLCRVSLVPHQAVEALDCCSKAWFVNRTNTLEPLATEVISHWNLIWLAASGAKGATRLWDGHSF
jgi:hypothetical protein